MQEFLFRRKQKAETTLTRMEDKQTETELSQRQCKCSSRPVLLDEVATQRALSPGPNFSDISSWPSLSSHSTSVYYTPARNSS